MRSFDDGDRADHRGRQSPDRRSRCAPFGARPPARFAGWSSRVRRALVMACLGPASCLLLLCPAAAEPPDVHEVEAAANAYLGRELTLFGRFASALDRRMRLEGSAIEFRVSRDTIRPRADMTAVQVVGRLGREGDKLVFQVDSLARLPDEVERFARHRRLVAEGDYQALLDLAGWAQQRGEWYDEPKLLALAEATRRTARGWEISELAQNRDRQALLDLAHRLAEAGTPQADVRAIVHQALVVNWDRVDAASGEELGQWADDVLRELPGADSPVALDEQAWRAYLSDPAGVFNRSDEATRLALARALWAELTSRRLLVEAQTAGGERLVALAEVARQALPDRPEVGEQLELQTLKRQAEQAELLSRGGLLGLVKRLRQHGNDDLAQGAITRWLEAAKRKLPEGDAAGLCRLADDHFELSGAVGQAARFYQEALRLVPDFPAAVAGMQRIGFQRVGGVWQPAEGRTPRELSDQHALQSRPVAVGDSEADVIARLRHPDRLARTATANQTLEQWIYLGPPRLYVYLRRNPADAQAHVIAIRAARP